MELLKEMEPLKGLISRRFRCKDAEVYVCWDGRETSMPFAIVVDGMGTETISLWSRLALPLLFGEADPPLKGGVKSEQ